MFLVKWSTLWKLDFRFSIAEKSVKFQNGVNGRAVTVSAAQAGVGNRDAISNP